MHMSRFNLSLLHHLITMSLEESFSELSVENDYEDGSQSYSLITQQADDSQRSSFDTPNTDTSRECSYKKLPDLKKYFIKQRGSNSHAIHVCIACEKQIKTNQLRRLVNHLKNCKKLQFDPRSIDDKFREAMGKISYNSLDTLWVLAMIENNFSFRSMSSSSLRRFFNKAVPDWKIPSRYKISDYYVPKLSNEIEQEFKLLISISRKMFSILYKQQLTESKTFRSKIDLKVLTFFVLNRLYDGELHWIFMTSYR